MGKAPDHFYRQSGVIPYRRSDTGLEVLLITTRKRKRWIIPKGVVEPHLSPRESAGMEAYEEAGIRGRTTDRSLGSYSYDKWGGVCTVEVFVMKVDEVLDDWPESFRKRKWVTPLEAADMVREEKLAGLLRSLSGSLR